MFTPHRRSLGRETVPRRIVWSRPRLHADCGAAHASPNDLFTLSRLSPCPPLPFIIRAKEDTASRARARTPSLQDSFHNRDCWKASTATCPWPPPPFELCTASPRPVLLPLLSWSRRALPFPRAVSQGLRLGGRVGSPYLVPPSFSHGIWHHPSGIIHTRFSSLVIACRLVLPNRGAHEVQAAAVPLPCRSSPAAVA